MIIMVVFKVSLRRLKLLHVYENILKKYKCIKNTYSAVKTLKQTNKQTIIGLSANANSSRE
jgi:hypothetical protein